MDALHPIIQDLASSPSPSLLSHVAAVHVAYYDYQQEIMWFGQLTSYMPGILATLNTSCSKEAKFHLHLSAVAEVVEDLPPPLDKDQNHQLLKWFGKMKLCQTAIDSILSLERQSPLATELRYFCHF